MFKLIHPEYAGYKCFVSLVAKQITSNTVVAMCDIMQMYFVTSHFKSSLGAVAGSVALFTHAVPGRSAFSDDILN